MVVPRLQTAKGHEGARVVARARQRQGSTSGSNFVMKQRRYFSPPGSSVDERQDSFIPMSVISTWEAAFLSSVKEQRGWAVVMQVVSSKSCRQHGNEAPLYSYGTSYRQGFMAAAKAVHSGKKVAVSGSPKLQGGFNPAAGRQLGLAERDRILKSYHILE